MTRPQPPAGNAEAAACHQRGLELLQGNQASLSLAEFERAVMLDPANAEFLKSLGNARKAMGDLVGAMASYRRSLEIASDYTSPRYNLGLVLLDLGRPAEAEEHFRRIRELDPRDAEVLFHLALLAADRSQFAAAAQLYRSALELAQDNPHLWFHLGVVYRQMPGHTGQSIECLLKSLELKPDFADAHHLVGNILDEERRVDEAAAHYREAIRYSPDNARAHGNLGDALESMGNLAEAIGAYSKAIELDPGLIFAHFNLGSVYSITGAHEQALRCYEAILRLRPDDASARGLLLFEMQRGCNWSRLDELYRLQRQSIVSQPDKEIHPFSLLCVPSTPGEQLQCARNYAAIRSRAVARNRDHLRFQFQRRAGPRLRIGYLSADLREHPVARLIAELIELHDRSRFEVAAYSYGPDDGSPMRARLKPSFDRFVDIRAMSNANAAARIYDDGVDILVDLTGYTAYNRTEIAALRPAPVQVNYLGYPGTMGADFIDYIVTDRFITPPGHEAHFSEQPVYLPGSYQANDRKRSVAGTPTQRAGLAGAILRLLLLQPDDTNTAGCLRGLDAAAQGRPAQRAVAAQEQYLGGAKPAPRSAEPWNRPGAPDFRPGMATGTAPGPAPRRRSLPGYPALQRPHHRQRCALGRAAGADLRGQHVRIPGRRQPVDGGRDAGAGDRLDGRVRGAGPASRPQPRGIGGAARQAPPQPVHHGVVRHTRLRPAPGGRLPPDVGELSGGPSAARNRAVVLATTREAPCGGGLAHDDR